MIYAGIVAGGTGSRMGADVPKQFLEIGGRAIIFRTIDRFLSSDNIDLIYVAVHSDWIEYTADLAQKTYSPDELSKIRFIEGGNDRNSSVLRIVERVKNENLIEKDDILLTHDAVRPFVTEEIISKNIEFAANYGICTTAIPATDTILRSYDGSAIGETLDRSELWQAQTPQSFRVVDFINAYKNLNCESSELTDVCGVFTRSGFQVKIVLGSPSNIKITTPFDLKIAESLI